MSARTGGWWTTDAIYYERENWGFKRLHKVKDVLTMEAVGDMQDMQMISKHHMDTVSCFLLDYSFFLAWKSMLTIFLFIASFASFDNLWFLGICCVTNQLKANLMRQMSSLMKILAMIWLTKLWLEITRKTFWIQFHKRKKRTLLQRIDRHPCYRL